MVAPFNWNPWPGSLESAASIANVEGGQFLSKPWRHGIDRTKRADSGGYGGVPSNSNPLHRRPYLFEQ